MHSKSVTPGATDRLRDQHTLTRRPLVRRPHDGSHPAGHRPPRRVTHMNDRLIPLDEVHHITDPYPSRRFQELMRAGRKPHHFGYRTNQKADTATFETPTRTITISIEEFTTKEMTIDAAHAADVDLTDDDQIFELFDSLENNHHPMSYDVREREISVTRNKENQA